MSRIERSREIVNHYGQSGERELQEQTETGFADEPRGEGIAIGAETSPKSPGQDDPFAFGPG